MGTSIEFRTSAPGHVEEEISQEFDNIDLEAFTAVAAQFGTDRLGLVVTPNVDHMIRLREDDSFRQIYKSATFVLLDSRVAALLFRFFKGLNLKVCTGADLTAALLARVVAPSDRIVIVGGNESDTERLCGRYGLLNVHHHNPPMGFIKNSEQVEHCLRFVEMASPFRFCFVALGSPQQEVIGDLLKRRGIARGLVFCIGASLNFLIGRERRAPKWMRKSSLEWVYRLVQNPRRMAARYLVRGPRFLFYMWHLRIVVRRPPEG